MRIYGCSPNNYFLTHFLIALLAVISVLALMTASACSSRPKDGARSSPSGGAAGFLTPTSTASLTLQEMEEIGGFRFVFPSYLPDNAPGGVLYEAYAPDAATSVPTSPRWERVDVSSLLEDRPLISIKEED